MPSILTALLRLKESQRTPEQETPRWYQGHLQWIVVNLEDGLVDPVLGQFAKPFETAGTNRHKSRAEKSPSQFLPLGQVSMACHIFTPSWEDRLDFPL